jgi:hypothetical protein
MNFEDINGGDIVFQHINGLKHKSTTAKKVVISETDFGEVFSSITTPITAKNARFSLESRQGRTYCMRTIFTNFSPRELRRLCHKERFVVEHHCLAPRG